MNKLIVVRHGEYSPATEVVPEQLSAIGVRKSTWLGGYLKESIVGHNRAPLILTSTLPRAVETARILADIFLTHIELCDALSVDYQPRHSKEGLKGVIDTIHGLQDSHDDIILVTHFENTQNIPYWYAREHLALVLDKVKTADNSRANVLDCVTQELSVTPRPGV